MLRLIRTPLKNYSKQAAEQFERAVTPPTSSRSSLPQLRYTACSIYNKAACA